MILRTSISLLILLLSLFIAPKGFTSGRKGEAQAPQRSGLVTTKLVLTRQVEHLDAPAREPMIIEHPSGAQFVTGYGAGQPRLWKSLDRGATWTRLNVGTEAQGAVGNSDVDLAVDRDGTIYFVTMGYNNRTGEGASVAVGVSRDIGVTWSWSMISKSRFDDRPWVAVLPDGSAHLIWNDGSGVNYAVSRDRGVSWMKQPRIHDQGGSSHLATGPNREVAVRITPKSASGHKYDEGVDLIAVSSDGGATWRKHPAPGRREKDFPQGGQRGIIPRWVEPLAWDARGWLYSLWTDQTGVWLARSSDRARTWTQWRLVESTDVAYYPYLVAHGKGELAATWFTGSSETLHWHVARIDIGDRNRPQIRESAPLQADSWNAPNRPGDQRIRNPAGEYLGVTFLRDGGVVVVSPIQDSLSQRFGFSWWRFDAR
jgi:hypothetical protein